MRIIWLCTIIIIAITAVPTIIQWHIFEFFFLYLYLILTNNFLRVRKFKYFIPNRHYSIMCWTLLWKHHWVSILKLNLSTSISSIHVNCDVILYYSVLSEISNHGSIMTLIAFIHNSTYYACSIFSTLSSKQLLFI